MAWAHLSVQRGLPTWRSPLSQVCTAPVLCGLTVTGSGRLWGHYRATQRFCPPTVSTHSPHLPTDLRHLESAWGSRHPRFLGLPGALTRLGGTPPPPPWSCRGSSRLSPGQPCLPGCRPGFPDSVARQPHAASRARRGAPLPGQPPTSLLLLLSASQDFRAPKTLEVALALLLRCLQRPWHPLASCTPCAQGVPSLVVRCTRSLLAPLVGSGRPGAAPCARSLPYPPVAVSSRGAGCCPFCLCAPDTSRDQRLPGHLHVCPSTTDLRSHRRGAARCGVGGAGLALGSLWALGCYCRTRLPLSRLELSVFC